MIIAFQEYHPVYGWSTAADDYELLAHTGNVYIMKDPNGFRHKFVGDLSRPGNVVIGGIVSTNYGWKSPDPECHHPDSFKIGHPENPSTPRCGYYRVYAHQSTNPFQHRRHHEKRAAVGELNRRKRQR
jgi:hypothetical protein